MTTAPSPRRSGINWRAVRAIAQRDLRMLRRSKAVTLPMILVPLLLLVIMPGALALLTPLMDAASEVDDLAQFLEMMPAPMTAEFAGYTPEQTMLVSMLIYFFAPLFLILPTMVASTMAAGSFAGEKERKTLEALLYTPTTDTELVLGKMLATWVPAVVVALGGFVLYGIVVNATAWPVMGRLFFPTPMWLILVLWTAPAAAGLGLGSMILVSSKVNTYQDAYQLGAMVVLPIVLLLLGQIAGVIYLSPVVVFLTGVFLWIVDAVILGFAIRTFQRSEIIARL